MSPLFLTSFTVVNALGRGVGDTWAALREERSGLRSCDFADAQLNTFIGRVQELESEPVRATLAHFECRNNRLAQLALRQDGFERAVAEAKRRYGEHRIAVVIGTSTSGIHQTELAYQQRDDAGKLPTHFLYRYTHNMFSPAHFTRDYLGLRGPAFSVSTACSSSAKVFSSARRLIAAGFCDAAIVGGVDSLCLTTLYGFNSLELLSSRPCRPFAQDRNGISIGEAAGFALLEKPEQAAGRAEIALLGVGESSDAHHMSQPHPEGLGALLAMRQALEQANLAPADIDYINFHGTATRANDAAEDKAVTAIFGQQAVASSSTKGWTGHTLGAAGITEAIISALCIQHGFVPVNLNGTDVDPTFSASIARASATKSVKRVLSNSFGFGGSNSSLIVGKVE